MAPFGRQWFSLQDRNPEAIMELVKESSKKTREIISKKQQELNLTDADTILCGFSQGTMMAVYLTLTNENPYHATVAFSGRLITPAKLSNTKTPICIIHGKADDVVPAEESTKMSEYLSAHNIENQKLIIPYLNHSIDNSGLEFAINFLKNKMPE
jgi:phospholipase/carboxylesterase